MQDSQGRGPEMEVQEQIWYKIRFAGPIRSEFNWISQRIEFRIASDLKSPETKR